MSGADDAASIAEQRKLQAQLLEAREDLDSSYRNHSLDARADALDKELEAYQDASDNYMQSLRDNLEDVDSMIESVMTDVVENANLVLQYLVKISEEYGVTLTNDLKDPWIKTSEQVALTKNDIDTMLDATEVTIGMFNASVNSTIDQMYIRMQQTSSDFTAYLGAPYKNVTASGGPINTFSTSTENALTNAVYKAKSAATEMTTSNKKPWNDGVAAINTWSSAVENAYNNAIQKAREYEAAVNRAQNVGGPSYYSGSGGSNSGGNNGNKNNQNNAQKKEQARKAAQNYINSHHMLEGDRSRWGQDPQFLKLLKEYQKYGGKTSDLKAWHGMAQAGTAAKYTVVGPADHVKKNTKTIDGVKYYYNPSTGWYVKISDLKWVSYDGGRSKGYAYNKGTKMYKKYAKGTLGTKKDQWAITDEPRLGDELTLVPTKQGNLSYMRKGTSVVPAAITEELLKLADVGVDGLTMPKFDSGINLNIVNNAINKPELNVDIENFLRCDNVNQDTMPELEKFVNKKMNEFMKQLNYAIRKFK